MTLLLGCGSNDGSVAGDSSAAQDLVDVSTLLDALDSDIQADLTDAAVPLDAMDVLVPPDAIDIVVPPDTTDLSEATIPPDTMDVDVPHDLTDIADSVDIADVEADFADVEADLAPPVNLCGGTSPLAHEPESECGPCGLDTWTCDGLEAVACSGETWGNGCDACDPTVPCALPQDPATTAPIPLPGEVVDFHDSVAFLYEGDEPIQTDAEELEPSLVGVLRGRVSKEDGSPLPGVTVSILQHSGMGQTLSRADGRWDLAVNAGSAVVVTFEASGYLPAQRRVLPLIGRFKEVPEVVLVGLDPKETPVSFGSAAPVQVALGSVVSDEDGERTGVLLFPAGTQAEIVAADGTTTPVAIGTVRITEYTVGPLGPERMPAQLPPSSGYTYAMELSLDEALSPELSVQFDRPLRYYVDNFLHFPVGKAVPFATFNRSRGAWEAEADGRVIAILGESEGLAQVDTNGDGWPDSSSVLSALGFNDDELQQLATLYPAGAELWRVGIDHFTPGDCNWPTAADDDADRPRNGGPRGDRRKGDPCEENNSIIACENQALGECVPVAGTPYRLCYWSDRVSGRTAAYTLDIDLTGDDVPPPLKRVELEVNVAGQVFRETFGTEANQTTAFTWDGLDAYGRRMGRSTIAEVRIGYVYDAAYVDVPPEDPSFGAFDPDIDVIADSARMEITFWQVLYEELGLQEGIGLGPPGWSLSAYHYFDPSTQILYQGSGGSRNLAEPIFSVIGGTGDPGNPLSFVGTPAMEAKLRTNMQDLAVGMDGSVYLLYGSSSMPGSGAVVFRITPEGILEQFAGGGPSGNTGDGVLATDARLSDAWSISSCADGGLLIAEPYRVRRVDSSGVITTIGGNGSSTGSTQEEVMATSTKLTVRDVAEGPDGTVYVLGQNRIRTIDTDGILHAFAGGGDSFWADGEVVGRENARFQELWDFDVASDGTIYVAAGAYDSRAAVISTDGLVTAFAGGGSMDADGALAVEASGDMIRVAAGLAGMVQLVDFDSSRVRVVDASGVIRAWAGGGSEEFAAGSTATDVELGSSMHIATDRLGDLYLTNWYQVLKVSSPVRFVEERFLVPSRDGSRVYEFDQLGRHTGTRDALLDVELMSFGYDEDGLLSTIADPYGNVTTVQRDADGKLTAIEAANGQETLLSTNSDGDLVTVTDPAGDAVHFTYQDGHLMATRTDPGGGLHQYSYDDRGLLYQDTNPDGGTQTLTRVDTDSGQTVTLTSSSGRTSSYGLEWNEDGTTTWTFVDEAGGETLVVTDEEGNQTATYPNGRTLAVTFAPDPRWGDLVSYFASAITTTPTGLVQEVTATKEVGLTDLDNPLSLEYETHTIEMNGRSFTRSYDAASLTLTRTSPEGRQVQIVSDGSGRVVQLLQDPSSTPSEFEYDTSGRLILYGAGSRLSSLGYDAFSRLDTFENAAGEGHTYGWTDGNRLADWTAPDTGAHVFAWEDGNRTGLERPDGDQHTFSHTDKGLEATYLSSGGTTAYQWTYDGDGGLLSVVAPSGRSVTWNYGGMPFPVQIVHDAAVVDLSQFGTSGQPGVMVRTPTVGSSQGLSFDWDGGLLSSLTMTGAAQGVFSYGWDSSLQLNEMTFTAAAGSHSTVVGRDDDGLITSLGTLVVGRGGPAGAPDGMTDGTLSLSLDYDVYGLLETRSHTIGATNFYELGLVRDDAGRIVERTEIVAGVTVTNVYEWDANGRLLSVARNGAPWEAYSWEPNDNRMTATVNGAEISATYEYGDRITTSGTTEFTVDPDGFVTLMGDTELTWSSRGELLTADVPGTSVTYSYDGFSRLTARSDGSGTTEYFRGNPSDPHQVTHLVESGQLTAFVYDEAGVLISIVSGGSTYYVGCDQVGSPRIVVDSSGAVVKVVERDSWGNVISDSNPAFELPIGFAGGLEDPVTGLVHFGFRVYDPGTGRWTSLDPLLFGGGQSNLYLYVRGDPVDLVDPSGLFCIGGSYYMGVGAGGSVCMTSEGVSYCAETGFGVGGGVSADVFGDLQRDGTYFGATASVDDGLVGMGLSWELDDCGRNSASFDCKVGWVTCSITGGSTDDGDFDVNLPFYAPEDIGLPKLPKLKGGLEAKVYGKACASYRW